MDKETIFALCWLIVCIFVILPILHIDKKRFDIFDEQIDKKEKRKRKIEKELTKLDKRPDLILCEPYHLNARFDDMITNIIGVPIVYAGLSGKPYVFVWLTDSVMELNEQCEKILKEQKK